MVVIDEAKLDEVYLRVLQIEDDMMYERDRLKELDRVALLKPPKEKEEIRALRESKRAELMEQAKDIFDWLTNFSESPKGRKILSVIGALVVFRGHYYGCKPTEDKEHQAWLTYNSKGVLRYWESCGGIPTSQGKVLSSPEQMVKRLHPNYVLAVSDAIATGEVWKEFECAIAWREEIFDIRRRRGWWPPQTSKCELSATEFLDAREKHLLKYLKSRPR